MAATKFKIKTMCSSCGGTGTQPGAIPSVPGISCFMCGGTGEVEIGVFKLKEIEDKLDEILAKLNE
jgi:hypothetical protein